ncbi:MAG: NAD(P)H oxidoreductase [Gemmatimonas sp. SG8_23]|jgi:glutathione-regulated potassium-efflux system ancillary protein KefG|nr:MAG: NAD(P)H oxidoreductase [Gemmatimonas sp. SG8_23]
MARVLILFAHPSLERSRVHRALLQSVPDHPDITLHDLYEAYPRLDIDVEREQALLLEHDVIAFQHPFYWYSTPPILKQWQDLVLEHGWAYGSTGTQLVGKDFISIISAGGGEQAYCSVGYNRFTVRQLLAPVEQTAQLCGMRFLPPFVVFGTHRLDAAGIAEQARRYRALVEALMAGEPDEAERARLADAITINGFVDRLVGAGA